MRNKFFISALAATVALAGAAKQGNNDNKELNNETAPAPVETSAAMPVMLPYTYSAAEGIGDKRGYLGIGAGTQANILVDAGYRAVDTDNANLSLWFKHNSTWTGKNSSPAFDQYSYLTPLKQKFNDNRLGFDFSNTFSGGTLTVNGMGNIDNFNYYAAADVAEGGHHPLDYDGFDNSKHQTYTEFNIGANWDGQISKLAYRTGLKLNHAGYSMLPYAGETKGGKDNHLTFNAGADYAIGGGSTVTLDVIGDYVKLIAAQINGFKINPREDMGYFLLTLAPRYGWANDVFSVKAGADIIFGNPQVRMMGGKFDDSEVRAVPALDLDWKITDGLGFYAKLGGGVDIRTFSTMRTITRYSDPTGRVTNTWNPLTGEGGFRVGPFDGFSAKLYVNYAMIKADVAHFVLIQGTTADEAQPWIGIPNGVCYFEGGKSRGFMLTADLNYKYRSLLEASAVISYNIRGDGDGEKNGWGTCYGIDLDDPHWTGKFDVAVNPTDKFTFNVGLELRKGRYVPGVFCTSYLEPELLALDEVVDLNLGDVTNLYAGATWHVTDTVNLWLKGGNLLNKRWDDLYGMGAQRLNVMAGVGLAF